jgi:uncharacterized spore protein YtfJ
MEYAERAKDVITVKRVFGEPIERNGITLIPAARLSGGAGGGGGEEKADGQGWGGGFGVSASPAGAFVIRGEEVSWRPAIDVNRIVRGAQLIIGVMVFAGVLRRLLARR